MAAASTSEAVAKHLIGTVTAGRDVSISLTATPDVVPPDESPELPISSYLALVDAFYYALAYSVTSAWFKKRHQLAVMIKLFDSQRTPRGSVINREQVGDFAADNPAGYPPGAYHLFTFRAVFSNPPNKKWLENVMIGEENGGWRIFGHTMMADPDQDE